MDLLLNAFFPAIRCLEVVLGREVAEASAMNYHSGVLEGKIIQSVLTVRAVK